MIKHIVCFKLKDNSDFGKAKAKEVLMSMEGKVPQIKGIQVGCDFLGSGRSFDVILEVLLESKEDLADYQNDPYHCSVVKKYMHEARTDSVAVDYEI